MGSNKVKKGRVGLAVVGGQEQTADEPGSVPLGSTEPTAGDRSERLPMPPSGDPAAQDRSGPRDVEVPATATRRRFTAEYKLRILQEADHCRDLNGIGSLLRREGLYSSHLSTWRQQREDGALSALAPRKRGRRATPSHPDTKRAAELERKNRYLERRLKQAEALLDLQKKVSEILGIVLPPAPIDEGE